MSPYTRVRIQTNEGSYFNSGSKDTGVPPSKLRPILHITCPDSMISYSKGSRGLFVPSRVIGIFTDTTISLSSRLRQRPDHYTIRAGRNLPDKEFRYLRTVIVTAAVYWGFNSTLLSTMTSPLNLPAPAGVRLYTGSFDLAQPCVFVKQLPGPILCALPSPVGTLYPEVTGSVCLVP